MKRARVEDECPKGGAPFHQITPPKGGGMPTRGPPTFGWPNQGLPHGGLHLPQNFHQIVGCPPPKGGPTIPTHFSLTKRGLLPRRYYPLKQLPTIGSCPPLGNILMFFTRSSLRKNSGRSQNISGTLQKVPDARAETFSAHDGLLRNIFSVSPKLFWFSLQKHFLVSPKLFR